MQLLPKVDAASALFLDFDGTLAELAPAPDAVRVPTGLVPTLAALLEQLDGALAIVTGRRIADVDEFLHPLRLTISGEHGAQTRTPGGAVVAATPPDLARTLDVATRLAQAYPGLLVERKSAAIALHYRHAPALEMLCHDAMADAVQHSPGTELLRGKFVFEVKPAGVNKGLAIDRLMQMRPFAGRIPIFAGDDVTDEDGFAVVQHYGGQGIKIGGGPTMALARCVNPAALRGWLAAARTGLGPPSPHSEAIQ